MLLRLIISELCGVLLRCILWYSRELWSRRLMGGRTFKFDIKHCSIRRRTNDLCWWGIAIISIPIDSAHTKQSCFGVWLTIASADRFNASTTSARSIADALVRLLFADRGVSAAGAWIAGDDGRAPSGWGVGWPAEGSWDGWSSSSESWWLSSTTSSSW